MYLIFDIGGTKTRIAVSENRKKISKFKIFNTPQNFEEAISLVKKNVEQLAQGRKIKAMVVGIAGPLDLKKIKLVNSPNLPFWVNRPLKKILSQKLKARVHLENDAILAGLGEVNYGAAKGKKNVAYLTIGTGVGGAKFINGVVDKNARGFEPGQQIINFDDKNNLTTLEKNISGSALFRKYKIEAEKITSQKIWQKEASLLAKGLNNIIVLWSPEIIVLGGSLMKSISLSLVKKHIKQDLTIFSDLPLIKKSKFGDLSGIYGGLYFLNKNFK